MESTSTSLNSGGETAFISSQAAAILDQVDNLPTLPQVFAKLQRIIDNEFSTVRDLVKVIESDQALTARILKYANSPLFRGVNPVDNVNQAVVRLGLQEVKNISLSIMVYDGLFRQSAGAYFNRVQFWKHSILVGHGCVNLVNAMNLESLKSVAFVAGLLHDTGIAILDRFFPDHFSGLIHSIDARREPLEAVEEGDEIPSHAVIGAFVLQKWRLPETVIEAVGCHHGPAELFRTSPLGGVVRIVDCFIRRWGFPFYVSEPGADPEVIKRTLSVGLGPESRSGKELINDLRRFTKSFPDSIPSHLESLSGVLSGF
jgi:putative nucleotidyltransferase with HDIG domain